MQAEATELMTTTARILRQLIAEPMTANSRAAFLADLDAAMEPFELRDEVATLRQELASHKITIGYLDATLNELSAILPGAGEGTLPDRARKLVAQQAAIRGEQQ